MNARSEDREAGDKGREPPTKGGGGDQENPYQSPETDAGQELPATKPDATDYARIGLFAVLGFAASLLGWLSCCTLIIFVRLRGVSPLNLFLTDLKFLLSVSMPLAFTVAFLLGCAVGWLAGVRFQSRMDRYYQNRLLEALPKKDFSKPPPPVQ